MADPEIRTQRAKKRLAAILELARKIEDKPGAEGPSIRLTFDPQTLRDMRQAVTVRGMSGAAYGLLDAFAFKLLEKIRTGEHEWLVKQKKGAD